MRLHTATETMHFAEKLENELASFYSGLSERQAEYCDVFVVFAGENDKNVKQVKRAYYEVITDAIEGGFAFDIETDGHFFTPSVPQESNHSESIEMAIGMEESLAMFYTEAAAQSKSLMADMPRTFLKVAQKHLKRSEYLKSLLPV